MQHALPPLPDPAPVPHGSGRVLVVDDNADSADTLAELLRMLGYDARTAAEGLAALQQVEEFRPHMALLDISLPGMDGYELARQVRARPGGEAIRLVALTGYGAASDRARSLAAKFDEHLVKPVSFDALTATITRLLA